MFDVILTMVSHMSLFGQVQPSRAGAQVHADRSIMSWEAGLICRATYNEQPYLCVSLFQMIPLVLLT